LETTDGSQRHPDLAWSAGAYVCHVTDNLRIWAERLAGIALGADATITPYDADLLADARRYESIPLESALWSLRQAVRTWTDSVDLANHHMVVLNHPERGGQKVADVCLNNAHDAFHHGWDIERTL
jgi:hypothetical protein